VLNVIILFGDMLQPNYLKEFISSDVTHFIIILTLLYFTPISIVVVSVHLSCRVVYFQYVIYITNGQVADAIPDGVIGIFQ
jgi:hypothetical protein